MGLSATPKQHKDASNYLDAGFDITREVVIGHVRLHDDASCTTPYQAAFAAIADDGQEGTYRFPGAGDGEVVTVTVDHGRQEGRA